MNEAPKFDQEFRGGLLDLFVWRRDVRHFRPDAVPQAAFERLLRIASLAPSVGLSQPWRFVSVNDPSRRLAVRACFETCNAAALQAQSGDRASLYARLKLAGLDEAPHHIAVFADRGTPQGGGLGRHTMPEMAEYSTVIAIHTLWLAARAEGVGLGWVSILEPTAMAGILDVPEDWRFIGYLCLGYPRMETDTPELEVCGWEQRDPGAGTLIQR